MKQGKTSIFLLFTTSLFFFQSALAQNRIKSKIEWFKNSEIIHTESEDHILSESFDGLHFISGESLPYYSGSLKVNSYADVDIKVISIKTEEITFPKKLLSEIELPSQLEVNSFISQERTNKKLIYSFIPFLKTTTGVEKIVDFELEYVLKNTLANSINRNPEYAEESVLSTGDIYKFYVEQDGMVRISHADLESFGINTSNINPKNIQIFGNPGGANPEAIEAERYDDLVENALFINGEDDGNFTNSDFILFYAYGPSSWQLTEEAGFNYVHNIYDNENYYYLKIGSQEGLRIKDRENENGEHPSTSVFDNFKHYEKDEYNLLADFESAEGSGQLWFSDKYSSNRNQDFTSFFSDADLDISEDVTFKMQFASRSSIASRAYLEVAGQRNEVKFNGVAVSSIQNNYADLEYRIFTQKLNSINPTIEIDFPNTSAQSTGWLDFIRMEYKAKLNFTGSSFSFRSKESLGQSYFGFNINSSADSPTIWDISNPENVVNQKYNKNNALISFAYPVNGLNNFVIFNPSQISNTVKFVDKIENQNLHSISNAEMLVIYHEDFESAASTFVSHRSEHSNLNIQMIEIDKVYNEFSSGKVDPSAIRNFARMLYLRDPTFNYLLLLGDASYDYKHVRQNEYSDENFIPVYETKESIGPINSFPTDDYYALLDLQEGGNLKGGIDIAVGRLPARTLQEAEAMVNKVIKYDTDPESFGDWRLRVAFAGDDEDNNLHLRQSDDIADKLNEKKEAYNQEKIYFDAFPQVSTPGGERYPQVTDLINNNIFKGLLTFCYLGHGGPTGWAQERVLKIDDIQNWNNDHKMPLFVTATCSFTGFDDPKITSAGESVILKEEGGAIGLFTTVRAVYANQNKRLTEAVFDTIFSRVDGEYMKLGEVLRRAKNSNQADTVNVNARKFLLIGDPSMNLAIPERNIVTSVINGQLIDENYQPDTIKALQKINFEGYVEKASGGIDESFNGTAYCSLFDKAITSKTLGNNTNSSPIEFKSQKTVLFKGQAEVINGKFNFEFFLPADINFEYGKGKISLYAQNGQIDAQGEFQNFFIGGSENANDDDNPPLVDVFLNTEDFAFGGISTSDPILLVKLNDDFGINVSGVSVGHDLVAELDNDSKQRYILNDFYESDLNDFRKGTVRFPLKDIEPGKHTLKVKAWDLSNNLGEGYTEFIVTDDLGESLQHVFNYPNPFSTKTTFQFEHNLPGTELEIIIHIYNMSGQIVKTIQHITMDDGFRVDDIAWDGTDDYGGKIGNGVYLYKINVLANQLGIRKESNFEKLVILK